MSYINLLVSNPSDLLTDTSSADEVFHCLICGSLQPKLQKFLSDSSQRLTSYFCKLYNVSSANDQVDIGVIFEDSGVCSQCNQELRDIENLYSQIERLKCEIQRIRHGCDSKLKDSVDNVRGKGDEFQGSHSGATCSETDTWRKREKLYKYAFPNNESTPADVFHLLDLDLPSGTGQSSAFSTVVVQEPNFIANPSSSSGEAIEETVEDDAENYSFGIQENSENGVHYEEYGSDEGHEGLYSIATLVKEDTADTDPLNVEKSSCWYSSEMGTTNNLQINNSYEMSATIPNIQKLEVPEDSTYYPLPEENDLSRGNRESDEFISPLQLLTLKSEVDLEYNVESSSELGDFDILKKKYNIRELSIYVERLQAIPENIKISIKPKRKYTRRELGTFKMGRKRPFSCPYPECCTTFSFEVQIQGHVKRAHQGVAKPFACELCDTRFTCYPPLLDHQNIHKGLRPHHCSKCDRTYATKAQLRCHQKLIHSSNPAPVNPRSKRSPWTPVVNSKRNKKVNVQLPLKPKRKYTRRELGTFKQGRKRPFSCPYPECTTTFSFEQQIEGHIKRVHEGVAKPFACELCDSRFTCYPPLLDHQNIHKGLRPYHCSKCDRTFATKIQLRCHRNSIHGPDPPPVNSNFSTKYARRELFLGTAPDKNRPFSCPHPGCTITFVLEMQRDGHIKRAHEGVSKPFSCDTCGQSFPGYYGLADHINVHKGLTPYQCSQCENAKFATKRKLDYHIKTSHRDDPFQCGECGKVLSNKNVFENHLRGHIKKRRL